MLRCFLELWDSPRPPGTRPWAFWEFEAGEHPDRRTETVADALFRLRLELTPRESVQLAREWPPAQYPRLTDPLAAAAAADRRAGWHRAAGRAEMAEAWAARAEELREFVRQSSTLLEPPAYAGIERQNALTDATRKEKRK